MSANASITIRRARRDDVGIIVALLADDPLGRARASGSRIRRRRPVSGPSTRGGDFNRAMPG